MWYYEVIANDLGSVLVVGCDAMFKWRKPRAKQELQTAVILFFNWLRFGSNSAICSFERGKKKKKKKKATQRKDRPRGQCDMTLILAILIFEFPGFAEYYCWCLSCSEQEVHDYIPSSTEVNDRFSTHSNFQGSAGMACASASPSHSAYNSMRSWLPLSGISRFKRFWRTSDCCKKQWSSS